MEQKPSVNLFQTQASLPPILETIERHLRQIRYFLLIGIFFIGSISLGIYVYASVQSTTLESKRLQLTTSVQQQVTREALLLSLRARVQSLKKILTIQQSIAPYIDTTLTLARPPRLTSFSLGDQNKVQISVSLPSMDEAVGIVQKLVQMANANKIRDPNLTSFSLGKDGVISMGLVYTVMLLP